MWQTSSVSDSHQGRSMTISLGSLREHLRRASEAVSLAELALTAEANAIEQRRDHRSNAAQLQQVKQGLLQAAREHLAVVRAAAVENYEVAGLPGLPSGRGDDWNATPLAVQRALAAAWKNLAEVEKLHGDNDACVAAYRQALTIEPDDVTAHAQLADLLESCHELAGAKAHAERALQADSGNAVAGLALARVFVRQQKFVAAERAASVVAKASRATVDDRALAWSLM